MPRTARTTRRSRKAKDKRRRREASATVEAPTPALEHGQVACRGCGIPHPAKDITSSRHCSTCSFDASIQRDHPGGRVRYWEQEHYTGTTTFDGSYAEIHHNATARPQVGAGTGPMHFMDSAGLRISDRLGPKVAEGLTPATQRSSPGSIMREEFHTIPITAATRRLFTDIEEQDVKLFKDRGLSMAAIGRKRGVSRQAVAKSLSHALDKMTGQGGQMSTMSSDQIEGLEAKGLVVAML